MQVILLERVAKLGQMGEVVKSQGRLCAPTSFCRRAKALRASEDNIKSFEAQKAQLEAQNLETKKRGRQGRRETRRPDLHREFVRLPMRARSTAPSPPVTPPMPRPEAGFTVDRKQIVLTRPIKELGLHEVEVVLHPEVSATIKLNVARSNEEAEASGLGQVHPGSRRRGRGRRRFRDRRAFRRYRLGRYGRRGRRGSHAVIAARAAEIRPRRNRRGLFALRSAPRFRDKAEIRIRDCLLDYRKHSFLPTKGMNRHQHGARDGWVGSNPPYPFQTKPYHGRK